jgi:hypothetical protein
MKYNQSSLDSIHGRCLLHYAHRADVLRLQACCASSPSVACCVRSCLPAMACVLAFFSRQVLHKYGGLYLDIDMVSVRPLTKTLKRSNFVIPWQVSRLA